VPANDPSSDVGDERGRLACAASRSPIGGDGQADFSRALELQPESPAALIARASAAHALGRLDEAQADLARLETLDLDDPLQRAAETLRQQLDTTLPSP
jgi:hypothetical protein